MQIAFIADVHANHHALCACIDHARARGVAQLALLGDLVGYGGEPAAVVARVMEEVAQGAWAVQGNHDALATAPPGPASHIGTQGLPWTQAQLSPAQRHFLQHLPLTHWAEPVLLVHASAHAPARWHYVTDAAAAQRSMEAAMQLHPGVRYVVCGHVHHQALYFRSPRGQLMHFAPQPGVPVPVPRHRQWLAVAGSCGQPRDGDVRAMYAVLDTAAHTLTFHRVPYDHAAAAQAVRHSDMPADFANRLLEGR